MAAAKGNIVKNERAENTKAALQQDFINHLKYTMNSYIGSGKQQELSALILTIRDRIVEAWQKTKKERKENPHKTICYLSLEFLMGRALLNNITNLGLESQLRKALSDINLDLDDFIAEEKDAGLGNGGLGRLAACFLDSLATSNIPAVGYGIRYNYGIFKQRIINGEQIEEPDSWLTNGGYSWEFKNPDNIEYLVGFGGKVETSLNPKTSEIYFKWVPANYVKGEAFDMPIVGWNGKTINTLRLWSSTAPKEFDFQKFNSGNYFDSVQNKVQAETLSQVLYPNDNLHQGKILRLQQQYFFVCCSIADIIRRFLESKEDWSKFKDFVSIQLNDTHPSIAIAELMRVLVDEIKLGWEKSYQICTEVFGYTNHTLLPEALETWTIELMEELLPRHIQIIYEINRRFLQTIGPDLANNISKLSIVDESHPRRIRMANLSIIVSKRVNGVANLHTQLLKEQMFPEFNKIFPGKFLNITNGVTQRRWLLECNPKLASLITEAIGDKWITDFNEISKLKKFKTDKTFLEKLAKSKKDAKNKMAISLKKSSGIYVNPEMIVDIQCKRIHEYKRQTLNAISCLEIYLKLKNDSNFRNNFEPLLVLFSGKAAPGYQRAKDTIKLINKIASLVNTDTDINKYLNIYFIPDYSVSIAEAIIPAANISEQISTAGYEASGTSCMKFMMNGAITLGTLDGANVEIAEEAGIENEFIFGNNVKETTNLLKGGYDPTNYIKAEEREVLRLIEDKINTQHEFDWILESTFEPQKDRFLMWADLKDYQDKRLKALDIYKNDKDKWNKMSLINIASSAKFSSDRTIGEYYNKIWKI